MIFHELIFKLYNDIKTLP